MLWHIEIDAVSAYHTYCGSFFWLSNVSAIKINTKPEWFFIAWLMVSFIIIIRLSAKGTNASWNIGWLSLFFSIFLLIQFFYKTDTLQNTWRWVAGLYSGDLAFLYVAGHPLSINEWRIMQPVNLSLPKPARFCRMASHCQFYNYKSPGGTFFVF